MIQMGVYRLLRQRERLSREMGMFFAELGYIPSQKEYSNMPNKPDTKTVKEINRIAGSWNGLLTMIQREQKDLWELIHKPKEVVKEVPKAKEAPLPKTPPAKVQKPAPKAKAKIGV